MELRDLFEAREQGRVAQRIELVLAQVVAAALHVADLERAEERFEEGDILEEELLLQIFVPVEMMTRCWRPRAQGGQQIGERFAGAGAGFDDEVAFVGEGFFDGRAISYWPRRCSKASEERDSRPPGAKKSWSEGNVGRFGWWRTRTNLGEYSLGYP